MVSVAPTTTPSPQAHKRDFSPLAWGAGRISSLLGTGSVFMAVPVFLCHVFHSLNAIGFIFVSYYFFVAGFYSSRSRLNSLLHILLFFVFYDLLYSFALGTVYLFDYPVSWFLVVYLFLQLLYRYTCDLVFSISCLLFAVFLYAFGFNYVWYSALVAMPLGLLFRHDWRLFLLTVPSFFLVFLFPSFPFSTWFVIPSFLTLFLLFFWLLSSLFDFSFLRKYVFHFYLSHVFFLGLSGVSWIYSGIPSFTPVLISFFSACFFSFCLTRRS